MEVLESRELLLSLSELIAFQSRAQANAQSRAQPLTLDRLP